MKKLLKPWMLWLVLGLLQLAIPASMVLKQERILTEGIEYRFRLAPYDPSDPFRGRYMNLGFDVERKDYTLPEPLEANSQRELYAVLSVDNLGFAQIERVQFEAPTGEYLKVKPAWHYNRSSSVRVNLPFKRFYLNENEAKRIEREANALLRKSQKDGKPSGLYGTVRIKEGDSSLTGLWTPTGPLR